MAPIDQQSPAPSMPPPNFKRQRHTGGPFPMDKTPTNAAGSAAGASASRSKRKKVDESPVGGSGAVGAAAKGKGRATGDTAEDDEGEVAEGDVVTKIDFRQLPAETLYKYLEAHELVPKWSVSPWSEDPVVQPHMLYSTNTRANPNPSPPAAQTPLPESDRAASVVPSASGSQRGDKGDIAEEDGEAAIAPTTRSKTAPFRKPLTPPTATPGPPEDKTRVLTLSDVLTARDVLAEKANAHWVKGLGGGQNKEGETIVNFLYKMKVGPGRLLRVYNPAYPSDPNARFRPEV